MAKKETKPEEDEEEKVKLKAKDDEEEDEKCNKEAEAEAEAADDDDKEDVKKKKKKKKEAEADMDEDEDEEETEKGELGGQSPAEDTHSATDANSSISPNMGVPSTQNVFVPSTGISVGRNATGSTPSETHYSGKSANTDLAKSPLFLELSKQMSELQKAFEKKLDAIEKSMNDRVANISKTASKLADFYNNSPLYKALGAEDKKTPVKKSLNERIALGEIQYQ